MKNDFTSWARLFQFSHRCFAIPTRGSCRRSLATLVNRQLQDEAIPSTLKHPRPGSRPSSDPLRTLAKRVSSKLEEGDYRGAVCTACSEDSVAVVTEEVISELKRKHPPSHTDSHIILPPDQSISSITVSEEICQAIRSFPNGSSGGPDGLRPQHLKDLTSASAEHGGKELIRDLTAFAHHVLDGKVPPSIQPVFFGATLIALRKEGGLRPIAVGHTLRCLVAKCAAHQVLHTLGADLSPQQLGCGVPLGCEAATHAARRYLHDMPPGHQLLKLDFMNAFNSLRRDKILSAVKDSAPELFKFVFSAYSSPSELYCGDHVIQSAGVQ